MPSTQKRQTSNEKANTGCGMTRENTCSLSHPGEQLWEQAEPLASSTGRARRCIQTGG
jgi:hypothetical protein